MTINTNYAFFTGRLTKDPEVAYTRDGLCIAKFSLAVNRGADKNGNDKGCDYLPISCCGKTAEAVKNVFQKAALPS